MTTFDDAGWMFASDAAYAQDDAWHESAGRLRAQHSVYLVNRPDWPQVWVVLKHADVMAIERQHDLFVNTDWVLYQSLATRSAIEARGQTPKTIIQMDDPDHRQHRKLTTEWFTARTLQKSMQATLDTLADDYIDRMLATGGHCDFAADIASYYPLRVILGLMGVPTSQEEEILDITRQNMATTDPEYATSSDAAHQFVDSVDRLIAALGGLTDQRRSKPTDDLASVIANGRIDGELLGHDEAAFYYAILATAGHDTVSSTLAGGLEALIAHPDAMRQLVADPSLLPNAVEEMLRWVSPAKGFMRLATKDYQLGEHTIASGERVLLSYPSANRDDEEFTDPFVFDIHRPNARRHLTFGFGKHYCLGAQLARMELITFFAKLLARVTNFEIIGDVERSHGTVVSGVKHLPIRFEAVVK